MELSSSPPEAAISNKHNMPMAANYGEHMHEASSAKQLIEGGNGGGGGVRGGGNGGGGNNISNVNNNNNNIFQGRLRPEQQQQQQPQQPTNQPINTSLTVKKPSNGVRYKECLKNHAANMGGYAVDGCGEFMPSGEEGSIEALKCAACGCHRNFHRREINGSNNMSLLALPSTNTNNDHDEDYGNHHNINSSGNNNSMNNQLMQGFHYPNSGVGHSGVGFLPPPHHHLHHHHQYMQSLINSSKVGHHGGGSMSAAAKRFRTKFTMEQREKMFEFSEKLGWRIQKHDEVAVQQFCAEAGVKRHVLKVWMHNNKNTFGKKLLRFPEAFNPLPEST